MLILMALGQRKILNYLIYIHNLNIKYIVSGNRMVLPRGWVGWERVRYWSKSTMLNSCRMSKSRELMYSMINRVGNTVLDTRTLLNE